MKIATRSLAAAAAFLALSQPVMAQGPQCIARADLADATTYAMPLFLDGLRTKCAKVLQEDSFVLGESAELGQRFEPLRDEAWPGMRRILFGFIESESSKNSEGAQEAKPYMSGVVEMLMEMKGEELRPFVDAMATQMIAEEIKPATCGDIEAVLPLLAPLPPENYGGLMSTILGLVADGDDKLQICPAQ
ncbi:hypothetical protein [Alteriqipengyuania sp. 357]